jgi:hypothetical protein
LTPLSTSTREDGRILLQPLTKIPNRLSWCCTGAKPRECRLSESGHEVIRTKRAVVAIVASAGWMTMSLGGGFAGSAEAATVDTSAPSVPAGAPSTVPAVVAPSVLSFAGYSWTVKSSTSPVGPGPNIFDPNGPFVDLGGAMHLRILRSRLGWASSEVFLNQTLGYGTYTWTIHGPLAILDPNVVLGLLTYDDSNSSPSHREIDFEASRWGYPSNTANAQYVVQPSYIPGNLTAITIPKGLRTTVSFTWTPGSVAFFGETVLLNGRTVALPSSKVTSPSVPNSSTEKVHMNLWLVGGAPPSNGSLVNVAVTGFQFSPAR